MQRITIAARFLIKYSDCALVEGLGFVTRVTYCGQPCSSQFTESAHHVKHDACLTRLTEVQVVPHDNVEKVVRRQCAVRRRLDVVAGDKELLPPIWGREDRSFRVVLSVGKKLQGQKRMSGPAFSQVNLDGVRLPFPI